MNYGEFMMKTMKNKIKITVEQNSEKIELTLPDDLDIYEMKDKLKVILSFLTYQEKTINKILND